MGAAGDGRAPTEELCLVMDGASVRRASDDGRTPTEERMYGASVRYEFFGVLQPEI